MIGDLISAASKGVSSLLGMDNAKKNRQLQKDFAQKGIRWKVEDAKAAGLHPLAALGATTSSFSPVSIGDTMQNMSAMGQDVGRAASAYQDKEYIMKAKAADLETKQLSNELLKTQIASENKKLMAPGTPLNAGTVTGDMGQPTPEHIRLPDGTLMMNPDIGMDWGEWTNSMIRKWGSRFSKIVAKDFKNPSRIWKRGL